MTGIQIDGKIIAGIGARPQLYIEPGATEGTAEELVKGLREHAKGARLVSACSWEKIPAFAAAGYRERCFGAPVSPLILDLTKGADQLFREFSETRRTRIRRAIRAKVSIEEMAAADFPKYYEIYRAWCGMKGVAVASYSRQEELMRDRSNRLVLVARHEGKIIAASIFRYRKGGMMEYAANASRREDSKVHPNDLLFWEGMQRAISMGLRRFSGGGSHFFLQRFGGTVAPTYNYLLDLSLFRRYVVAEVIRGARTAVTRRMPPPIKAALKRLV
ncbi:MAG: GNAT family N-acetyltransferase [Steroidobacteraceae bacterium]